MACCGFIKLQNLQTKGVESTGSRREATPAKAAAKLGLVGRSSRSNPRFALLGIFKNRLRSHICCLCIGLSLLPLSEPASSVSARCASVSRQLFQPEAAVSARCSICIMLWRLQTWVACCGIYSKLKRGERGNGGARREATTQMMANLNQKSSEYIWTPLFWTSNENG